MAEPACVISNGIQVRGRISGSGDLVVQGRMKGEVSLQASVRVEQGGVVVAILETEELTVDDVCGTRGIRAHVVRSRAGRGKACGTRSASFRAPSLPSRASNL